MKYKHKTIYIRDEALYQQAKKFANENGVSFSELVERAVYNYINPRTVGADAIHKLHLIRELLK